MYNFTQLLRMKEREIKSKPYRSHSEPIKQATQIKEQRLSTRSTDSPRLFETGGAAGVGAGAAANETFQRKRGL